MLSVDNISVRYGDMAILDRVSFTARENRWLMIVGPNGAGKSTVVHAISQAAPYTGEIRFAGQDIASMRPARRALHIGVLRQSQEVHYAFTVGEIARLGRYAHAGGFLAHSSDEGEEPVRAALAMTGMTEFAQRSVLKLSGGEMQRAFLAQVFAQDPQILLLDEPTNHLDLQYQAQMFALIRDWVQKPGRAVISVVHDLSLARAYGDDALLLHKGKVRAAGEIEKVLTRDILLDVYGLDVYDWMRDLLGQWEEHKL